MTLERNVITAGSILVAVACSSTPATPDSGTQIPEDTGAPVDAKADVVAIDGGLDAPSDASVAPTLAQIPAGYTQAAYLSTTPVRSFSAGPQQVLLANHDYVAILDTDIGSIVLDLYEDDAPKAVNSFVFLSLNHFYEKVAFHRVITGFMAQTGDPNTVEGKPSTWGTGGPGYKFGLEVKPSLNYDDVGILGMARSSSPDSNGSQFFITFNATANLNQQYTIWGKATGGLDVLAKIAVGEPPKTPTRITEVRVASKAKATSVDAGPVDAAPSDAPNGG